MASETLSLLGHFAVLFANFSHLVCAFVVISEQSGMAPVQEESRAGELVDGAGCPESGKMSKVTNLDIRKNTVFVVLQLLISSIRSGWMHFGPSGQLPDRNRHEKLLRDV